MHPHDEMAIRRPGVVLALLPRGQIPGSIQPARLARGEHQPARPIGAGQGRAPGLKRVARGGRLRPGRWLRPAQRRTGRLVFFQQKRRD